ncbi:hypothetical protein AAKU55_004334 [Oxalobacteraceae bacterium GrIS 1.11]
MQVAVRLRHNEKLGRITVPPTVALLRYVYDAETKRARQERVGTVGFWAGDLPPDVQNFLTSDEHSDWYEFVNNRNHQEQMALQRFYLQNAVRMLAYASKALQAGEKPASPSLARKAAKLFLNALDDAGFGEGTAARGRPRKDAEMDADFLLLKTPEEVEHWEHWRDMEGIQDLPQFTPPGTARQKRSFPDYPEGDLIAHALRLAFVGGEGSNSEAS